MQRLLWIVLLCSFFVAFLWEAPTYHRVVARNGDGVYALLRRYDLDKQPCNFEKFYELNKLKAGANLIKGAKYYIPVLIYKFDGKSIRTTIGITDWDKAVRIKKYNETILSRGLRASTYAQSKILWVPHHELHCGNVSPTEQPTQKDSTTNETTVASEDKIRTPAAPKKVNLDDKNLSTQPVSKRTFPIFGSKYAYTPLESTKLRGKVFYIVGGHGGPDPGAIGTRSNKKLCEDEYAYDVALRLCRNLIAHGATAYMIVRDPNDGIRDDAFLRCDSDEVVWGNKRMPRSQKPRLTQRSDAINKLYASNKKKGIKDQVAIMIHVDSRNKSQQIDLFFYHHKTDTEGGKVAQQLHKTMKRKYKKYRSNGQYHGTVTTRDLHMLREVAASAVYIELGNIRHYRDQQRIILKDNRQAIANWLLEGLMK